MEQKLADGIEEKLADGFAWVTWIVAVTLGLSPTTTPSNPHLYTLDNSGAEFSWELDKQFFVTVTLRLADGTVVVMHKLDENYWEIMGPCRNAPPHQIYAALGFTQGQARLTLKRDEAEAKLRILIEWYKNATHAAPSAA